MIPGGFEITSSSPDLNVSGGLPSSLPGPAAFVISDFDFTFESISTHKTLGASAPMPTAALSGPLSPFQWNAMAGFTILSPEQFPSLQPER
jgi:hypothetical protein